MPLGFCKHFTTVEQVGGTWTILAKILALKNSQLEFCGISPVASLFVKVLVKRFSVCVYKESIHFEKTHLCMAYYTQTICRSNFTSITRKQPQKLKNSSD